MRKIAIKLLMVLSVSSQVVLAQNIGTRNMNQDSTSLVPNAQMMSIQNSTNTTTSTLASSSMPFTGTCGASNNSILTSSPTSFLCDKGIASAVTTNGGTYSWTCTGNNYGNASNVASCSAQQRVVGQCNSGPFASPLGGNSSMCQTGTASAISTVWLYDSLNASHYSSTWLCNGNYGAPASCSGSFSTARGVPVTMCTLGARDYISLGLSGSWPSSVTYKGMSVPVPGLGGTNYISGSTGRYRVFNIPGGGSNPMVGATLEITCIP